MKRISVAIILVFAFTVVMTSCGGGGGGGGSTPTAPVRVSTLTVPFGMENQPYPGGQMVATGGTPPYTWSSSTVPAGLLLSSTGALSGTTPPTGGYTISVRATDSKGLFGTANVELRSYARLNIYIDYPETSSNLAYGGRIYIVTQDPGVTATLKLVDGELPPGLSFGTAVTAGPQAYMPMVGTPTQSGIYSFTVEATDSLTPPRIDRATLKMYIDVRKLRVAMIDTLPAAKRGFPYTYNLWTTGGQLPITCSVAPGSAPLPPGITIGPGCTFSGTPTQTGNFSFTIRATDSGTGSDQQSDDRALAMSVIEPVVISDNLPDATTGEIYTATPTITGGTPPYSIVSFGASTCCLVFETNNGTIHGVPHRAGSQSFSITVLDSAGQMASQSLRFNVIQGPFRLGNDGLPRLKLNQNYSGNLSVISGKWPITWNITSGVLPPGLWQSAYNDVASFSGYPSAAGVYPVTLEATDSSVPPQKLTIPLVFNVQDKLPRNDTVASADYVFSSNDYVSRTISPYADPVDISNPDQDYYHLRAFAGEIVDLSVTTGSGMMDPVMEIVDSNGQRFATCRNPGDDPPYGDGAIDTTPLAFDDSCMNDDVVPGSILNSQLTFRVPGASGTQVDFYVHVLDFRGDARPDFGYGFHFYRYQGLID